MCFTKSAPSFFLDGPRICCPLVSDPPAKKAWPSSSLSEESSSLLGLEEDPKRLENVLMLPARGRDEAPDEDPLDEPPVGAAKIFGNKYVGRKLFSI